MSEVDKFLDGFDSSDQPRSNSAPASPAPSQPSEVDAFLKDAPSTSRGFSGVARDVAATALKGAIAVPEAVVGLADIPTGGRVGRFLENKDGAIGFRPREAREFITENINSDAHREAQQNFQEAEGVIGKTVAALQNPSVIVTNVAESIPSMLAGGLIGRGVLAGARGMGFAARPATDAAGRLTQAGAATASRQATTAGAIGEGAIMAGSQAEGIRQETEDGLLTPTQAGIAAATGVLGGAISRASGGLQRRLGIGDVDTMAVQGIDGLTAPAAQQAALKSIPRQVIEGAITEGFLEELPQSVSEQILQNIALGKNWAEDVDSAIVLGALSGGAMGAGAAGARGFVARPAAEVDGPASPRTPGGEMVRQALEQQILALPAPTITVDSQGTAQTAGDRNARLRRIADGDIVDVTPIRQTPSARMGLDPQQGPLTAGAAIAVDTGVAQQAQLAAAAQAAGQPDQQDIPQADPETGEIIEPPAVPSDYSGWSDEQLSVNFRTAQVPEVRRQLVQEIQRRREAALQAELDQEIAAPIENPNLDAAFASVSEDAGEPPADLDAPQGGNDGTQAPQAQQASAQPAQTGAAQAQDSDASAGDSNPAAAASTETAVSAARQVLLQGGSQADALRAATGALVADDAAPTGRLGAMADAAVQQASSQDNPEVENLRAQLRAVEDQILQRAPDALGAGGGDIEAAMRSRKVPVPLKAQRRRLQEALRQASENAPINEQNIAPTAQGQQAPATQAPPAQGAPNAGVIAPSAQGVPTTAGGSDVQTTGVVLQNRDRSTTASIDQMNAIAAAPDYLRTGPSRTMDQGAPVVFGDAPANAVFGREETVADGRGSRIRTRYAVVEAQDIIPSNNADGTARAEYANGQPGKVRAVAGNGRAAGLIEAYNRGTTGQYRAELEQDAQALGVDPAAIRSMRNPVLVRVMDEADVTPDIGDRSNTAATAALSPVEQAANDARRIDIAGLEFQENGEPTDATVQGFIYAMPVAERGNMLNPDGTATRQAIDRLMAATFKQAYGNDELVRLYAQATDPQARAVMSALAQAAGPMANLSGAQEFDLRAVVAQAAGMAVNASRQGKKLSEVVSNADLDMNPEAFTVAEFFAANIRSAKRMAEGVRKMANLANEQAQIVADNALQSGMFGAQPTLSRNQVLSILKDEGNAEQGQAAQRNEQQGRGERAGQVAQRPTPVSGRQGDVGPSAQQDAQQPAGEGGQSEGFLTSPTREDILAQQDAQEQAQRAREQEDARAEQEARAERERREIAQRSEAAADTFTLGGDAMENLTGQGSLLDAPPSRARNRQGATAQPAQPQTDRVLGRNADGQEIRADANGVRYYTTPEGVRVSQAVRITPSGAEPAPLTDEFRTVDEARAQDATPQSQEQPSEIEKARADLNDALADLADIFGANFRANMMPEQQQRLLPVLTRVLDAAFRLGYHKFKDAAKFSLEQIRQRLGQEAADAITLEHLQGAYIGMSGGKDGVDSKRAVIDVETKAEIEAHTLQEAVAQPVPGNNARASTFTHSLYNAIRAGNMPKDNPALKRMVESFDGQPASQERMKRAQEELETAIVMAARDIAAQGKGTKATFDELLALYESQPNLNIRTSTSIANQAYSTPAPLAYLASKLAGITGTTVVHEPTAGTGMLLMEADPSRAIVNELNDTRIEALRMQGFEPQQKDAANMLLVPEGTQPDAVITNPPFGSLKDADGKTVKVKVDGYNIGQIDHLIAARALQTMKDDGRATLIIGANKVAGGLNTDDRIFFNWLYSNYNVVGHFEVDGDLYTRQGAGWPVRVITINGRQQSDKLAPAPGTIQRVDNWSDVYEQFQQSLAAANAPRVEQPDAAGEPAAGPAAAPAAADRSRSRRSARGDGNVAGARAGAAADSRRQSGEPVAPVADEQRLNAQSYVPQPRPGQGTAAARQPAQPAGSAALAPTVAAEGNEFQSPYVARSARKDEGVLIPSNMAQPLQDALSELEDAVGDIDEFARSELGYETVEQMHQALMGLQVDSVAMSIYQMKRGKAVVIADQTGIGKGRQAASIIRWAARQGLTPIFVSVKPSLFTDMYGDLADIGTHDIAPFIMNSDAWIAGPGGEKLYANKASQHRRTLEAIANNGELPDGRNALFMTYSQINTDNVQRRALLSLANNAVFVLDESHNAAGDSGTGQFMISALQEARGVTYLSATYAKRPDNMPLYFKTDIGDVAQDSESLADAMAAGGLPLQTVVANNLVKAGQMFRRERSYDGVSIASTFDTANRRLHERLSDTSTQALRAIVQADRLFHEVYVKQLDKEMRAAGRQVIDNAGNKVSAGVQHTEFSSVVHNFVRQMLLGLKAQTAADEAIASLKRGEKPIIAVENTMGSFLAEYAAQNMLTPGDSLGAFDYRTVLSRALERSRAITVVAPTGDKTKRAVPLSELDAITRQAYDRAAEIIDALDIDIPVSPIDWMRAEITRAGHSVAEITGRKLTVDYSDPANPVLSALDMNEQRDKVATTRRFNSGDLDALVLNVAGSTGISLHASERFADQRQRHMIVAQAAGDINIFMQMLGRIHRTGQVRLPKYTILSVDLPTEKRPTAVLSRKMKSLNANTSSNTESATSVKTTDFLNKYGDQIVNQYLQDNPALAMELGLQNELASDSEAVTADLARKATGRLALQPIEVQRAFYEDVESQYEALIDYLNKTNQNDLEPRTFDFDAQELRTEVLFEGENKATPFGQDAIYGEYSIKAQGKPMKPDEIRAAMAENLGDLQPPAHAAQLIDSLMAAYVEQANDAQRKAGIGPKDFLEPTYAALMRSYFGDAAQSHVDRAKAEIAAGKSAPLLTADDLRNAQGVGAGMDFIRSHPIGSTFRVDINSEPYNAVVTNIRSTHKSTGNPFSLSKVQVTVAVNGALRSITVPATQFRKIEVSRIARTFPIESLFKEQPANQRETAKIVTGNLLAAYGELSGVRGTIINFTKADGTTEQGILLPKAFDFGKNTQGDYRLRTASDALRFLQESQDKDIGRFGIASRDGTVRVLPRGEGVQIRVPKSKAQGGRYFLDQALVDVTGDFVSSGNHMVATVEDAGSAQVALDLLMKKKALYVLPSMANEARSLAANEAAVVIKDGVVYSQIRSSDADPLAAIRSNISNGLERIGRQGQQRNKLTREIESSLAVIQQKVSVPISLVRTVADARERYGRLDIPSGIRGIALGGRDVTLIAENLNSVAEAEFVLFHELLHIGLARTVPRHGAAYGNMMNKLAARNKNLADQAKRWREAFGAEYVRDLVADGYGRVQALQRMHQVSIEEALADLAGANPNVGWVTQFLAELQRFLRNMGFTNLADWMEGTTNAQALQVIAGTRKAVVRSGDARMVRAFGPWFQSQPAFSRSNENAIELTARQAGRKWRESVKAAGTNPQAPEPNTPTPAVLRAMGAKASKLVLPRTYLRAILEKHPDVPAHVFENLPEMLADPLFIIPHRQGGLRVFVDATTAKREPIFVGVDVGVDGRIHTVSPLHDWKGRKGSEILGQALAEAMSRPGRIYAKNKEALGNAVASARASAAAAPAMLALHRESVSNASVVTRDQIVKGIESGRYGDHAYSRSENFDQPASYSFRESDYRPAVVAWAKEHFGDAQAPNGKPTWQNFVRWFGDSKAVDADGKPQVFYHGTGADFSVFDGKKRGSNTREVDARQGFFLSSSPEIANEYAQEAGAEGGANIMPAYVSLQNPLVIDENGRDYDPSRFRDYINQAKDGGRDGVILRNTGDGMFRNGLTGDTAIAFRPEQIKSATGNRGNFDPTNADIRFSRELPIRPAQVAKNIGDGLKAITRTDAKGYLDRKLTDWLRLGLQFLGRRQLVDIYGKVLPMREYDRLAQQMEADKNDAGAFADELARRWGKLKDERQLAELMHDATLAQIDADVNVEYVEGDDRVQSRTLKARFAKLSPEAQAVYREARDHYKQHNEKVRQAIKERIQRSELRGEKKAELLRQMDSDFFESIKGVYFPLARFGQYVVAVKDADGKVVSVSRGETANEAEALRQELRKAYPASEGYSVGKVTLSREFIASRDMVGRGFMTNLYEALDKQDLPTEQLLELEDTLGQLYLTSLPDLSWAKHGIHRKGTPGFSQDARRAFAQNVFHGARYLAKLRYSDLMATELDNMQKAVDAWSDVEDFDQPKAQRVVDEMNKRHEVLMNPKTNPLSTALTSFGFMYHLGLSPAAAMVNLSQTALVAYPIMAGKWGYRKASAALIAASNEAVRGKNDIRTQLKDEQEIEAYDEAVRAGVIDVTMAHDLAGIAQGEDSKVSWKLRPMMRWASFLFHHAERFNRQVTFVASYRLAREAGRSHHEAYADAVQATYDGHFDYGAANRPRVMQGNVARVVLLFKQFAQNMIYTLARQAYLAAKGDRQAQKTIAGILVMHAAAAGVLGLPMVGTLLTLASAIGGSEDEPWDAEVALRNSLADLFGPKVSEVIAKGFSRLTPWDVSGRVGLDNLLLPDVREGLEGKQWAQEFATALLGPVMGIGLNAARGSQLMADGDYARGLESMMPTAFRNGFKSLRYATEGELDTTGVPIKDEVSMAGIAGQLIGFSPSEVRLAFEGKSAVMSADRALQARRSELLAQFARAAMKQDQEGMREADEAIRKFNQANPGRRITAPQKWQSVRNRQRRIDQAEDGVYLPRTRREALDEGRFAFSQ